MLAASELHVLNTLVPTHDSGTVIDLFLAERFDQYSCSQITVESNPLAQSDHRLVYVDLQAAVDGNHKHAIPKVSWGSTAQWTLSLGHISILLASLEAGIQELLGHDEWRPPQCGGSTGKKLRRLVLDLCAWNRDFIYVFTGHTMKVVTFSRGERKRKRESKFDGAYFSQPLEFPRVVSSANFKAKQSAVAHYANLLQTDRGEAAKFLSSVFKPKHSFRIQLKDEEGAPLDAPGMITALVDDLFDRACNDFPQDASFKHDLALRLSSFRSRVFASDSSSLYSENELLQVLNKLESSKKCIRGCFAALKAPVPVAQRLTLTLMNLGRQFGLTSSLWALREFRPLHKKGPLVVSKVCNLRPISLCCDLAHIQDGLWMMRNKWKLIEFAGPAQSGGVLDPISSIIGLVLLTQIRSAQSLPTFWAILDLKWAFDTAILPGMKVAVGDAGVHPLDWLLLDDIMDQDVQCLSLHGFLSKVFKLGCGTAQGRKFSVGVFTALLRWLHDEIDLVEPGGTRAWLPAYVQDLLFFADLWSPVREETHLPPRLNLVQDVSTFIHELLPDELNIQRDAFFMAVSSLCSLTRDSERRLAGSAGESWLSGRATC